MTSPWAPLVAALAGFLSLGSACGVFLLPAFLAGTSGSSESFGGHLLRRSVLFALGLLAVLVPLGLGAGSLGSWLLLHRGLLVTLGSVLLVLAGLLQLTLGSVSLPDPLSPVRGWVESLGRDHGPWARDLQVLLTGILGGALSTCTGPVLGSVLVLAASSGSAGWGVVLLVAYTAGIVLPLTALAWLLEMRLLTGVSARRVHQVTGVLLVLLGIVIWQTNGLVSLPVDL